MLHCPLQERLLPPPPLPPPPLPLAAHRPLCRCNLRKLGSHGGVGHLPACHPALGARTEPPGIGGR